MEGVAMSMETDTESPAKTLQQKADALPPDTFVGGPRHDFERVGRLQLITLLRAGMYPDSDLLDVGCGCLRGGYWTIHFLDDGRYCGIEPNEPMLRLGTDYFLEAATLEQKQPRFDSNDRFDFSVFGRQFDFVVARSIWTHASKTQIQAMLDSFLESGRRNAVFLTSYYRGDTERDYGGASWVGESHESMEKGVVRHRPDWIAHECSRRDLAVRELTEDLANGQRWLMVQRSGADARPSLGIPLGKSPSRRALRRRNALRRMNRYLRGGPTIPV